ncbi:hypothetical protein C211_04165 [Stutzerimonas degradans]|nr:hypothetical protein C211_04165 [Stutzerimonas degradans]
MDQVEVKLELWKKTIEVQMHFNELEMKIRNFAILLISAFVGGAGLALKDGLNITRLDISLASVLFFCAAFLTMVFYAADRFWYHPLLLGSVKHAMTIEQSLTADGYPESSLTTAVGNASAISVWPTSYKIRSSKKIAVFYISMAVIFLFLGFLLMDYKPAPKTDPSSTTFSQKDEQIPAAVVAEAKANQKSDAPSVTINLNNSHSLQNDLGGAKDNLDLERCLRRLAAVQDSRLLCGK